MFCFHYYFCKVVSLLLLFLHHYNYQSASLLTAFFPPRASAPSQSALSPYQYNCYFDHAVRYPSLGRHIFLSIALPYDINHPDLFRAPYLHLYNMRSSVFVFVLFTLFPYAALAHFSIWSRSMYGVGWPYFTYSAGDPGKFLQC